MQRADTADSTRRPFPSPGKSPSISTRVVLEVVNVDGASNANFEALSRLANCSTLITAASEAAEEAGDQKGFWYREPDYAQKRLAHIFMLLNLVQDEIGRLENLVGEFA